MTKNLTFLQKELTYRLYGIFLKIGKDLGCDFKEEVYQKSCLEELTKEKIKFVSKPTINLFSRSTNNIIGFFKPDLIIEDLIIIEIKAKKCLLDSSINQLLKYLEKSKYEIGYLVNFGTPYTQIIRRIYTNDRKKLL